MVHTSEARDDLINAVRGISAALAVLKYLVVYRFRGTARVIGARSLRQALIVCAQATDSTRKNVSTYAMLLAKP